jgi:hypothetical protein
MPLLFKRIQHFCFQTKLPLLTQEQRIELGKQVMAEYQLQDKIKEPIQKVKFTEPEVGEILVCAYPKGFIFRMDELIREYYKDHSPPVKKERKRIPLRVPENKKFKFYPKPTK